MTHAAAISWHRLGFLSQLFDEVSPRVCAVCGQRLCAGEELVCNVCNMHLIRSFLWLSPSDNEMARLLWGHVLVERVAALCYFFPQADISAAVYRLKYQHRHDVGVLLGKLIARSMAPDGFFDGVDMLVPVPLTKERRRERGYNQSTMIAWGIAAETGISVAAKVLSRKEFNGSQTHKNAWQRREDTEHAFCLEDSQRIRGKHVMLVDDVMTTGSTVAGCAKELMKADGVRVSCVTVGFARS